MASGNVSITLEVDSKQAELELHKARMRSLVLQRSAIDAELKQIDERLQELCDHNWHWHQIAGEGRYCTKCMKHDLDCDD